MVIVIYLILAIIVINSIRSLISNQKYKKAEKQALSMLGYTEWNMLHYFDEQVVVKSRQALAKYDDVKFFKDDNGRLQYAENELNSKKQWAHKLRKLMQSDIYQTDLQSKRLDDKINELIRYADAYRVRVDYITSAGNNLDSKELEIDESVINKFKNDPSLLMTKSAYNKLLREQRQKALADKQQEYYGRVNEIIDLANENKDRLAVRGDSEKLDQLITQLFDRTVNSIKKIKQLDSEEWDLINNFIAKIKEEVNQIVQKNEKILAYYESASFDKIKETCASLMSSQREFNEYIREKVDSISKMFGMNISRNETVNNDSNNYVRPYKKSITPFTAEVSATVFASAENNPMEYIVKKFYPNKSMYPEQIQKLYQLVEELETLKDARQIIDNYKAEYKQYLGDVPEFIMEYDDAGFYSRLGFAYIDESSLTVEYKFSYTSNGGMAHRSFTVPMTEETIVELIRTLENKLTAKAFAAEQRNLMTKKLREFIKARDNFTCCNCGNSTHKEPNLLLEIDHIVPVSKGGYTVEDNLQTLCWKCNRAKSDKIIN